MAAAKAKEVTATVLTPVFDGEKRIEIGGDITVSFDEYVKLVKQGIIEETHPIEE